MTSQLEALRAQMGRRKARPGAPHVVAVTSGRGGAGVSLISALLAIGCAHTGRRTLLVDAEPWLDVQRVWLGLEKGPGLDALGGDAVESLVVPVHGTLELLSLTAGPASDRAVRGLMRRVPPLFHERDLVVLDVGTRLLALERLIDLRAGTVVVVSANDAIGLASTHAMLKALYAQTDVPSSILFNRSGAGETERSSAVLQEGARRFLGRELNVLGSLPEDPTLIHRLAGGARLPEALVQSSLPSLTQPLLERLLPPAAA